MFMKKVLTERKIVDIMFFCWVVKENKFNKETTYADTITNLIQTEVDNTAFVGRLRDLMEEDDWVFHYQLMWEYFEVQSQAEGEEVVKKFYVWLLQNMVHMITEMDGATIG